MTIRINSNRLRIALAAAMWLLALAWFVAELRNAQRTSFPWEPLLAFFAGLLSFLELGSRATEKMAYALDTPLDRQHRDNLLKLTRTIWQDYLEQALHQTVRLDLPKREAPHLLARPPMLLRVPERADVRLPPHTELYKLFVERGRSLLILGAPGSGKSVTLAELCVALLDAADADPQQPAPVILDLTSWGGKETLDAWLERRLNFQFELPTAATRAWLDAGRLIPLLDGLDEVAAERRAACLEAINTFRAARGAPCVVCSRLEEYEALRDRLHVGGALLIEPLEDVQIAAFLAPEALRGVRAALDVEPHLHDLARSPLFLNVLACALYDMPPAQVANLLAEPATRRRNLWDAYIQRALRHRPLTGEKYGPHEALHWLAFLARQLTARNRTEFYVEELQFDGLPLLVQRHFRRLSSLAVGLVGGLTSGLGPGLFLGLSGHLIIGLVVGLCLGLFAGLMASAFSSGGDINLVEGFAWRLPSWREVRRGMRENLGFCLFTSLANGLFFLLIGLDDTLGGSVVGHLVFGLFVGLAVSLSVALELDGPEFFPTTLTAQTQRDAVRRAPGQGVVTAARHALHITLVSGLGGGLVSGLSVGLLYGLGLNGILVIGLWFGLYMGPCVGWMFGGEVIQHYALRWVLGWAGLLPGVRGLLPWLAAMHDRLLLRRTGGSYRFLHRYLQEHFAALSAEDVERLAATLEGGVG